MTIFNLKLQRHGTNTYLGPLSDLCGTYTTDANNKNEDLNVYNYGIRNAIDQAFANSYADTADYYQGSDDSTEPTGFQLGTRLLDALAAEKDIKIVTDTFTLTLAYLTTD